MEGKVATIGKQKSELDAKLAAIEGRPIPQTTATVATAPPKTWLQDRIENHASLSRLEPSDHRNTSPSSHTGRRYDGGYSGSSYSSATFNYNNTYIVAPRAPQPTPPPPAKYMRPVSR